MVPEPQSFPEGKLAGYTTLNLDYEQRRLPFHCARSFWRGSSSPDKERTIRFVMLRHASERPADWHCYFCKGFSSRVIQCKT